MSKNTFLQNFHKNQNAQNQRAFRAKHPHYNSYQCYCKRRRKKGLEIEYTYEQWVEDRGQYKKPESIGVGGRCINCKRPHSECLPLRESGHRCCEDCFHSRRVK
jgi:hypothetical protein